jgi:peptide/nickel transport system permease protein
MIAPVIVLALVETAVWAQFMRSSMLDALEQDYIRTARAKGVPARGVIWSHALRNALLPMITLLGLQFPTLLGGALVTETVFNWPGMGRLFLDSLEYRDYPVIMGILMLSAVMVLMGSLLADILYAAADPRIKMD